MRAPSRKTIQAAVSKSGYVVDRYVEVLLTLKVGGVTNPVTSRVYAASGVGASAIKELVASLSVLSVT